jgi:proline dehydrogenase
MGALDRLVVATLPLVPRAVVARVARRYIAGETLEDALRTVKALRDEGCDATVDVLGEFITAMDEARTTARAYEATIDGLAGAGLVPNASVKLTAFGLLLDRDECETLVRGVARKAAARGGFVRIDMEDSPCTDRTLEIHDRLRGEGLPVGVVIQARLRRTPADAARLAAEGASVRLCKGIYREPEAIAHRDPDAIRAAYLECLRILLDGKGRVAMATHDRALTGPAEAMLSERRVPASRVEFQMLLGVLPELRRELLARGHALRVYVPYGADWYGYSTRRLRENPEVAGHVFRAMFRSR